MSQVLTSIIIPVFNQVSFTDACLTRLYELASFDSNVLEIIVIDNGSTDQTPTCLRTHASQDSRIKIERFEKNVGFNAACNHGAEVARGEFLLFLNNDTLPTPGWLSALQEVARNPSIGIVGPKLIYPGNHPINAQAINHAGFVYNPEVAAFYAIYHSYNPLLPGVNKERDYQALLGACLLIRRELFLKVRMFALYGLEDIDLCLKVKKSGYRVVYTPRSMVVHHGSVTLQNTAIADMPNHDNQKFMSTWTKEDFIWDDYAYFAQDQTYAPEYLEQGKKYILQDRLGPSTEALRSAFAARDAGNIAEAQKYFKSALHFYEGNIEALSGLMLIAVDQGAILEAVRYGEIIVERAPYYRNAYENLATLYRTIRRPKDAETIEQKVSERWTFSWPIEK